MNITLIVSCLLFLTVLLSLRLFFKISKMKDNIAILLAAYANIEDLLSLKQATKTDNDVHKENFIKFLSDSRDWAYQYIEDVQKGLNDFVSAVDSDISYFDEYGEVLSMSRPDYDSMKKISMAYKQLKTLLPTEEDKNV